MVTNMKLRLSGKARDVFNTLALITEERPVKTYQVLAESTGGFMVAAENEAQAEKIVLDHMHRVGTPYISTYDVKVLSQGSDKVLSVKEVT